MDTPRLAQTPGTILAIPLRCNSPDHLFGRRIVLHDDPFSLTWLPNIAPCLHAIPRSKEVHHIIDANDPDQRQVWVVPQTRASHNGTEPRSLKVCSKRIQRLECSLVA